jgi:calcineurin-like phosphoesterase family protein
MVTEDDLVIHLGDVVVGKATDWSSVIPELPGRKVLVLGNHDRKTPSWYMANGFEFCCVEFSWEIFGLRILFSHEPRDVGQFDLNIHGHLHLGRHREHKRDKRHYLVALENTSYQPRTLKRIVENWKHANESAGGGAK